MNYVQEVMTPTDALPVCSSVGSHHEAVGEPTAKVATAKSLSDIAEANITVARREGV